MAAGLVVALLTGAEARAMRMVVADLPYGRVWDAALRAVAGYPVERAADGEVLTGWREREPAPGEAGWSRVRERIRLRLEPAAERITRVSVVVEAQGRRGEAWVALPDAEARARDVLARLREAMG